MSHSFEPSIDATQTFEQKLCSLVPGREEWQDMYKTNRLESLERAVEKRNGYSDAFGSEHIYSAQFVLQQAAQRLFEMMEAVVPSMDGKFTEDEVILLLNANCGPIWHWRARRSIASDVADSFGVEELSDLENDSDLKLLLIKLMELDSLQNLALTDLCERYWRSQNHGSLTDSFESMGLVLAE